MADFELAMVEFPADDPERARAFWEGVLGATLDVRTDNEGAGWQTHEGTPSIGVHKRGAGPGDSFSLPYFEVEDVEAALQQVQSLGGTVVHPGASTAVCKDSEGTPFALMLRA